MTRLIARYTQMHENIFELGSVTELLNNIVVPNSDCARLHQHQMQNSLIAGIKY